MKFNIITFGCKVNSYESEFMKEQLINNNFKYCDDYKKSNIVIVNTCSVTNTADNKCKKIIRDIRRDNKDCILMVCGCTSENHREELNDFNIDILIGNQNKSQIVELINNYLDSKEKYIYFSNTKKLPFEDMRIKNYDQTRAFVKIQDGCNNYCAYCIIPYTRGNIRSKDFNEAVEEINNLANNGYKEIVFTGINTGAYGRETNKYDLTDLIQEISKNNNLERIRVSSIEITEITDKFINELKNNKKLCGHLHVSLQSGSDKILKLMNRKYTKEEYLNKINKIREARPNINLTTDVITGFPGETEEDFQECIDFCKKVKFSKTHVFPYSNRKGTKADTMPNQLDNKTKKDRARRLIKIDEQLQKDYNDLFINKEVEVLIEEVNNNQSIGHTENFLRVIIDQPLKTNTNYKVKIIESSVDYVKGKV